jgi:outer membrane cobalamin receptor
MSNIYAKFLFFLLFISSATGYCGTLKGNVSDKQTGEPIIGGVVLLHGTSYGTTTGLDGSYEIKNVPAGEYDLEMMYTSFTTFHQHIVVKDAETLTINELLEPTTGALTEVEVKAKAKNGSDEQARNIEKNSDQLLNVMSARTIELLPDITVANVLQRVSGVQVERDANGEARYAAIRGMDKRYNYTTVDGVKIASPDDKARFVPLDIFPAEILDRVEVIKSLTPDMEGDAIGGVTNLVMKNAPDKAVIYATAATGYNDNLFNEKFNSFDKSAIASKDPYQMHGQAYNATVADFPLNSSVIKPIQPQPNGLYSLSIGNRFFKNKRLGVMFSGSYQNTFKETNNMFFKPASQPVPGNVPEFDDLDLRKYSTQETRTGLHANIDYQFNERNSITLGALYINLKQFEERNIIDSVITAVNRPGPGLGTVDYKDRTGERIDNIQNLQLKGKHQLTNQLKIDWTGSYSQATRSVPDLTEFTTESNFKRDPTTGGIVQSGPILKSIGKSWEKTTDQDYQGFLNITYTPTLFGKELEFKAGVTDMSKTRTNYYNEYSISPVGVIGGVPYTNVNSINPATINVSSSPTGTSNDQGLDYKENENILGYYAQVKLHFMQDKLEVLGGVRIENTYVHDSANLDPHLRPGVYATYNYSNSLPSLHLKYKLSKKENLRLSYFESICRPGFFELVNYTFAGEDFTEVGNPNLVASVAQNLDLRYEWFPKGIDQVLVGAFYKNIQNPIEYVLGALTGPSNLSLGPQNLPNPATNYGFEFVVTKYFHYFGVTANYTYTHSSVTVPSEYLGVDSSHVQHIYNVTETRPLQGQAAHVGNIALIYKNPKLGLDVQLGEQYTGRHITIAYGFKGLDYWQRGLVLSSFSAEKRIVKHLFVYAKINNLLNSKSIVEMNVSNSSFNNPANPSYYLPYQNQKDGKTLVESSSYGRNYLIGIRYKID